MMRFGENMELYNEYELISHSKLADCSMFIVDMVYRPMHLHKEMELCYILSGTCRVSTDRQSFTAGAGGEDLPVGTDAEGTDQDVSQLHIIVQVHGEV